MITIILITLVAWIAHVVSKLMAANKKYKAKFHLKVWLKNQAYYLIFSFLCVILALTFVNFKEIPSIQQYGISINLAYVIAGFIGWSAPSMINKMVKIGTKKLKENE